MQFIDLFFIIFAKIISCKIFGLAIFLIVFAFKGKKLEYRSDKWDEYFLTLSEKKLDTFVISVYIIADLLSSAISYFLLNAWNFEKPLFIAALIFILSAAFAGFKYYRGGREKVMKRYKEIPETILKRR